MTTDFMRPSWEEDAAEIARRYLAKRGDRTVSLESLFREFPAVAESRQARSRVLDLIWRTPEDDGSGVAEEISEEDRELLDLRELDDYVLLGQVGEGGMGIVFEAYQRSTGRRTAVKVMNVPGADAAAARFRFEREVELAARLNHPHIVTLLDSGVHRGRYYCVLEFIEGLPLGAYVARQRLSQRAIVELFAKLADAVEYAHQRGVLHRDLKPANVLVDEHGEPHILDFGLAKAIDPDSGAHRDMSLSRPGQLIGTLAYMSPEQARGNLDDVSVRSDVYALGAMLYEQLSGRLPIDASGPLVEVLGRIASQEPPPVSRAAPREQRSVSEFAGARHDLDAVLMMALQKRPADRYAGAGLFAEELRRLLRGDGVDARAPTRWERVRRFSRRHRALTFGTAATFLALSAGAAGTSWQAVRATHARDDALLAEKRATDARDRAVASERQAQRRFDELRALARAVMFDFHDLIADLPGATPAREALIRTALQYLDGLSADAPDDPELLRDVAAGYERIGDVQGQSDRSNLGDSSAALASYRRSLECRRRRVELLPDSVRAHDDLAVGLQRVGDMLLALGNVDEAETHYVDSLTAVQRARALDPADLTARQTEVIAVFKHGAIFVRRGEIDRALAQYAESTALCQAVLRDHPDDEKSRQHAAIAAAQTGFVLGAVRRYEEAVEPSMRAAELFRSLADARPESAAMRQRSARMSTQVADLLTRLERHDEAAPYIAYGEQIAEELAQADPQNMLYQRDLMTMYAMRARRMRDAGDLDAAHETFARAVEVARGASEADPEAVMPRREFAAVKLELGALCVRMAREAGSNAALAAQRWREARDLQAHALEIFEALHESGGLPAADVTELGNIRDAVWTCEQELARLTSGADGP